MSKVSTRIFAFLFSALLPALFAGLLFASFVLRPVTPAAPQVLVVAEGAPMARVAGLLAERGIVSSSLQLKLLARLRGDGRSIKAGEYEFAEAATPSEILNRLVSGDVRLHRFTIPEGQNLFEIAARIEAEDFGEATEFLSLVKDPAFAASFGIEATSLEGYLFPETYSFTSGTSEEEMISAMVRHFEERITPDLLAAAKKRGLDRHELVTLASIVQKEAGNDEEMGLIASVFHNRLKKRIMLQADPTVIYGIENFDGNLTRKHLKTPTPYNTYRMVGLPAGPIASPGLKALHATANPAESDYLYFVADSPTSHVFSRTLKEHNRAVRKYQLKR